MSSEDLYDGLVPPEEGQRARETPRPSEEKRTTSENPTNPGRNTSRASVPREVISTNQLISYLFKLDRKLDSIQQNLYQININFGDLGRRMSGLEKAVQINNVTQNILTVKGTQDQLRQSVEKDLNQVIDKISAFVDTYREDTRKEVPRKPPPEKNSS